MSKEIDKRLQMYIVSKAIDWTPFGRVWNSSAKKLEDVLSARGIKLPKKIYYEYKLPGGKKPSGFMAKLVIEYFISNFYSRFSGPVLADKSLSVADKAKLFKYVLGQQLKFKNVIKQYEKEIRQLNPELANLKIEDVHGFVYGATFGFAPDEIEYFSNPSGRNATKEGKTIDLFDKKYGIEVGYVLAPETAKMIIAALEQNTLYNSKER